MPQGHIASTDAAPLPSGEGSAPGADRAHPTADDIDRLFEVAGACREPKEAFGRRLREIMGLNGDIRIGYPSHNERGTLMMRGSCRLIAFLFLPAP
jgi:hypothetical protein